MLSQMCLGMMTCSPISKRPGEKGLLYVKMTSAPSAVTLSRYSNPPRSSFCSSKLKTTSSAVMGSPSDHWTPSRRVNVTPRPSSEETQSVASHGVVLPSAGL